MATYARIAYTGDGKTSNVQSIGFTPTQITIVSTDSKAKISNTYITTSTETVLVGLSNVYPSALTGVLNTSVDLGLLDINMSGLNNDGANYILYAFGSTPLVNQNVSTVAKK